MTTALPEQQATLRLMARPNDTNIAGDIFGGWMMSQCDIAGSIVASRQANGRVVTVAVNQFVFLKPVLVGDIVSIYAQVTKVGNTSITISINVFVERKTSHQIQILKVVTAELVFVHIDENRHPSPLKKSEKRVFHSLLIQN